MVKIWKDKSVKLRIAVKISQAVAYICLIFSEFESEMTERDIPCKNQIDQKDTSVSTRFVIKQIICKSEIDKYLYITLDDIEDTLGYIKSGQCSL